ncbi:MAG: hypothetical protein WCE45_11275 [Sedimentisphaerales bacterium]
MNANRFSNTEMDPCHIEQVIQSCQAVDELVTSDPGSSSLEVLERLRLKMCDLLKLRDYSRAEKVKYCILLRWQGMDSEADILEKLGL